MKLIKRIIAVLILIPALFSFLLMVGAAVGSLLINDPVTEVGVSVLTAGEGFVGTTLDAIAQVDTLLVDAQSLVTDVESELDRVGDDLSEDTVILDGIAEMLDTDLATLVGDIDLFFSSVQQAALALADVLDALFTVPGLATDSDDRVDQNLFRDVADDVDALSGSIDNLLVLVQRGQEALSAEVIADLKDAAADLTDAIAALSTQIDTLTSDLTTLQTEFVTAQTTWTQLVDPTSIVLMIVCLFVALAFLSLTVHAWAFFRQVPAPSAESG